MTAKRIQTAEHAVKESYPDAQCVRSMFGLAIVVGTQQVMLCEARSAAWPEEAWIEAASKIAWKE